MIKVDYENMDITKLLQAPKPRNGKIINIFWSGGVDSTYMMLWLLCHGYCVNAYWIEIGCNNEKNKKEHEARRKIIDIIEKEYQELSKNLMYFHKPAISLDINGSSRTLIQQAPIWLLGTQLINNCCNDFAMGYVSGDDAVTWIDAIKNVVKSYNQMTHSEKHVKMHFPLMNIKKVWFYEYIPFEIRKNIFWCEYGKDEPKTCRCSACITHRHMLDYIDLDELEPVSIKKKKKV